MEWILEGIGLGIGFAIGGAIFNLLTWWRKT